MPTVHLGTAATGWPVTVSRFEFGRGSTLLLNSSTTHHLAFASTIHLAHLPRSSTLYSALNSTDQFAAVHQCSRLEEAASGQVHYRFEWSTACAGCPLRDSCLGKDQRHRTVTVGQYHTWLQGRRREQRTDAFKAQARRRNAIEGTQSELVRGHGLRRARYRGRLKVALQNYLVGAACNLKRWIRRQVWQIEQAALAAGVAGAMAAKVG